MLLNRSLPYMTGFSEAKFNAGEVMNRGVELSLNTVNINGDGKDNFRWESGLTFYRNKNKIVHLFGKDANGKEANDTGNATTNCSCVGYRRVDQCCMGFENVRYLPISG